VPNQTKFHIDTQLIHAGERRPPIEGAVSLPIFQSSTFTYDGQQDYHDIHYIRLNNTPNHSVLNKKLSVLERGEAAMVTASGMAAITTTFLSLLKSEDHLLAQNCLYGGTHDFLRTDLARLGIMFDFIDGNRPDTWAARLRPQTGLIYVETLTNPLLEVADLAAVAAFARRHGLVSVIDNTFASPVNFRPIEHGFDLVVHSCTKYLNGHSDIVAGAVIGKTELVEKITHTLNHLGASLDPHACFLLQRGMKTLGVRVRHQNRSAQQIAEFLSGHPRVARLFYPGLSDNPYHGRARELFDGFGGMVSFEIEGGRADADAFIAKLELAACAPSLGGAETLITRPASTSHSGMTAEERRRSGISDKMIRLSVGLEAAEDLIADMAAAL
jgi:cystathionine beta-lyase/cystathionine gamma-synthase